MEHNIKTSVKLLMAFLGIAATFYFLFFVVQDYLRPMTTLAQEPTNDDGSIFSFSDETLRALGIDPALVQASNNLPYDLEIIKTAADTEVDSGDLAIFDIIITNKGPNPVSYALFYDNYPAQMTSVSYSFSVSNAVSNGLAKPTWLIPGPINAGKSVSVTVSGIVNSATNTTVPNTATIDAYNSTQETNKNNNSSTANISIKGAGGAATIYLPFVAKAPPIVLAYFEDFNSGNPWVEFNSGGCKTDNISGQYWVDLEPTDRECLPPAKDVNKPESPYRTYGEFEVAAYHSEGQSNAAFGLFINGQGGSNYYLFRIYPNNNCTTGGGWVLRRRKSGSESVIAGDRNACHSAIKRGLGIGATNVLKITHTTDRKISVFANGTLLGSATETVSNHLTGTGTGVYVRSADKNIRVKFDNFKVFRFE